MDDNVSRNLAPITAPFVPADALLGWYDVHARALPWRAPPGTPRGDPYCIWLSEVMLQQTQVASVIPYFERFTTRWPSFAALAAADDADVMSAWAGLGYYARARNLLACARVVARDHGGTLPGDEAALRALPGFGPYTAAAVAAIAFGQRAVVVDGNVERVVSRVFAVADALPGARPQIRALTDQLTPDQRAGDFAQAMMDLGATICTPRNPKCLLCPLSPGCAARAAGTAEGFPVKIKKPPRPVRYGTLFWLEHNGAVWLVRRPAKGLLGGMRALPTGVWGDDPPGVAGAPVAADWAVRNTQIRHVFTHFELRCALATATWDGQSVLNDGAWWPIARLESAGLPTVFAKGAAVLTGV